MELLAEHLLKPMTADKQIETDPFLEAMSHLPPSFDCLQPPMFLPINAGISGNIMKIKAVYDTNPAKFRTLQNILEAEKEMYGTESPKVGTTLALMWLKRGLRFIQIFLQRICDGEQDRTTQPHLPQCHRGPRDGPQEVPRLAWAEDLPCSPLSCALPIRLPESALQGAERDGGGRVLVSCTATTDVTCETCTKMNAELNTT
ncbi:Glycolipid transfer protein [Fukomys damarensis]|uniref:Glycolipid transfer protein n=1 Tax=Fukomys damarensis TaxID=885580 RepID=A0A091DT78_FUKDA|nr:Glycolipid transfer protein [Fukomys damarensis]